MKNISARTAIVTGAASGSAALSTPFCRGGRQCGPVDIQEDAVEEVTHAPSGTDKRITLVSESSTQAAYG